MAYYYYYVCVCVCMCVCKHACMYVCKEETSLDIVREHIYHQANNIQRSTASISDFDQRCVLQRWILTPLAHVDQK